MTNDCPEENVLLNAIQKQEEMLQSRQNVYGEFDPHVSDDLAQLALLYNMNGEYEKALPLLHKRLVIHEKFGPDNLVGESLQELGTTYRLHGVYEVALQHLERALAIREICHGAASYKVAETINSIAMLHQARNDPLRAEEYQLKSLQILHDSAEPEDMESEDIPWEVYKRLRRQRAPTTSQNSVTLLKGNLRKAVMEAIQRADSQQDHQQRQPMRPTTATNCPRSARPKAQIDDPVTCYRPRRLTRAQSDSAVQTNPTHSI